MKLWTADFPKAHTVNSGNVFASLRVSKAHNKILANIFKKYIKRMIYHDKVHIRTAKTVQL